MSPAWWGILVGVSGIFAGFVLGFNMGHRYTIAEMEYFARTGKMFHSPKDFSK
jgi:hypothetical protein